MNIGFYTNQLCERGTEIAVYDYAYYNQTLLNNKSFIFYLKNHSIPNNDKVIEKFNNHFLTIPLDKFDDIDEHLLKLNIKILYNIKYGVNDNKLSKVAKNVCHCVFVSNEPHGDIYCSITPWIKGNNNRFPVIPHIVHLPECNENMQKQLNIPDDAIVFGRHGGYDDFNIDYVKEIVYDIAFNNSNIYFLFLNTKPFCPSLKNIIHLDCIIDLIEKRKFINTCDAMIWARGIGETFGLSIAEFSFCNKPVIATNFNLNTNNDIAHYHILQNKGIWYNSPEELKQIFLTFDKKNIVNNDWNAYKQFSPENVMKTFKEVVIDPFT